MPRRDGGTATVLVVDDEQRLRHLIQVVLEGGGFHVECADDGDRVVSLVQHYQPQVVLLDVRMQRVSGIEALRALRAAGEDVPVIVVSAAGDEKEVLAGFEAGADDYIVKPFLPRVLIARVRAVMRRAMQKPAADTNPARDAIALDAAMHEAEVEGRRVRLSPTEFELLRTLIRGHGRVYTADELLESIWGKEYVGQDEIVRANIYRLRQKLEPDPAEPRFIHGRRGLGYFFAATVT
jgi:two-component system response regulator MtrA